MIVPMKKYSFLVFHRDYEAFLRKLGKLGVLHVIENEEFDSEESIKDDRKNLERTENTLKRIKQGTEQEKGQDDSLKQYNDTMAEEVMDSIEEQEEKIITLENRLAGLEKEIDKALPWGDYEHEDIEKLNKAGYVPRFYSCEGYRFDKRWEDEYNLFIISKKDGYFYFIVVEKEEVDIQIDAEQLEPAEYTLAELRDKYRQVEKELLNARQEYDKLSGDAIEILDKYSHDLKERIRFKEVFYEAGSTSDNKVMILEGWVPNEKEEKLNEFLDETDAVSLVNNPGSDDKPPVKLKNSRFSRLFEPISEIFDLPAYNELDLTPFFAPFFMLFFGFCLGDAGYGVFFILFAGLLKLKAKKELKPILSLAQYLGIATIIFGLLSGTFFGINLIDSGYTLTEGSIKAMSRSEMPDSITIQLEEIKGIYYKGRADYLEAATATIGTEATDRYKDVILKEAVAGIPMVGKFRHLMQDPLSMFYLSLLIGCFQILFGIFVKILNITRRSGFKHSLSTLGWLLLIITLIIYYSGIFDQNKIKYFFYAALAVSGILIFILNNPGKNVLVNIGSGLWDSYSMVTGLFGDLLSYIRLFALGISSAILGFVFNDISLQLLNIPYLGWLLFLILLIIGHGINIFLATLGGFIHPMRLTFVEFYKNAGFKGGGKRYEPFVLKND